MDGRYPLQAMESTDTHVGSSFLERHGYAHFPDGKVLGMEGDQGLWLASGGESCLAVVGIKLKAAIDAHVVRLEYDP